MRQVAYIKNDYDSKEQEIENLKRQIGELQASLSGDSEAARKIKFEKDKALEEEKGKYLLEKQAKQAALKVNFRFLLVFLLFTNVIVN